MKRNIRIFAVLLVICMFMTSINVYALDTNKDVAEERIFTKAELACMTDGSFGTATGLSDEFIEVKNIEGKSIVITDVSAHTLGNTLFFNKVLQ